MKRNRGGGDAVWASFVTTDLLPMTVGKHSSPAFAEMAATLLGSIGLHSAQVIRFNSAADVVAFDVFGAGDIGEGGSYAPRAGQAAASVSVDSGPGKTAVVITADGSSKGGHADVTQEEAAEGLPAAMAAQAGLR